jgi:hypothetical protein
MSDQLVAKVSTYTGQQNIKHEIKTSMRQAGFEPAIPATKRQRFTPYTAWPPEPVI